jgi:hypothetical protein
MMTQSEKVLIRVLVAYAILSGILVFFQWLYTGLRPTADPEGPYPAYLNRRVYIEHDGQFILFVLGITAVLFFLNRWVFRLPVRTHLYILGIFVFLQLATATWFTFVSL